VGFARLTFHERAAPLRALGKKLLNSRTSSTRPRTDRRHEGRLLVDIDGGIGTMLVFASKGSRELPNNRVYLDGNVEQLSKGGTFLGQHICVPLEGAAVHINAFNFPVWGMLENSRRRCSRACR
jgi:oxepin-CoA hydrolase/3-oxo-5,6-dehydrosuberyl-CoA semialdehyde dehydrogenase